MRPTSTIIERVQKLVTSEPVEWRRIDKGYTVAERWVAHLENGTSVFVKRATDEDTAGWLRAEYLAYEALTEDFLPKLIAWEDASDPILILEDLSSGFWPPPWSKNYVEQFVRLLDRLGNTEPPKHFPSLAEDQTSFGGWQDLAKDPSGFLGLGLVSAGWLRGALPVLIRAEAGAELAGEALVHGDPRSLVT